MTENFSAQAIAAALFVGPRFDAAAEAERRIGFIADYLGGSGLESLVLGISGGVDSTVAGRLCQLAVERLRAAGRPARFIAMRLPYGAQLDEADAQAALRFIRPDETLTADIRPAAQGMLAALKSGLAFESAAQQDFVFGNNKARQRLRSDATRARLSAVPARQLSRDAPEAPACDGSPRRSAGSPPPLPARRACPRGSRRSART